MEGNAIFGWRFLWGVFWVKRGCRVLGLGLLRC